MGFPLDFLPGKVKNTGSVQAWILYDSAYTQDSLDQCPMPIKIFGIDVIVDQFRSMLINSDQ